MKKALTIAGFDPTGGAGLQADLKVFSMFGVHGLSVLSSLTAQNTTGVSDVMEADPDFFKAQLYVLLEDIKPDALKTGMLYSADVVEIIKEAILHYKLENFVIDPVLKSSSGKMLADKRAIAAIKAEIIPLAKVITPNLREASVISEMPIADMKDMYRAAGIIHSMGPEVVVVTGGHLESNAIDLCFDGTGYTEFPSPKLPGEFHGTGCAFSSAITANLAKGASVTESVSIAKEFITSSIKNAGTIGKGMKLLSFECQANSFTMTSIDH